MKTNKLFAYGLFILFSIGVFIEETTAAFQRKREVALLRLVWFILRHRNVHRSSFTSRRDNNDLWGMSERLDTIIRRINSSYKSL